MFHVDCRRSCFCLTKTEGVSLGDNKANFFVGIAGSSEREIKSRMNITGSLGVDMGKVRYVAESISARDLGEFTATLGRRRLRSDRHQCGDG
jgi:hypothetical protein